MKAKRIIVLLLLFCVLVSTTTFCKLVKEPIPSATTTTAAVKATEEVAQATQSAPGLPRDTPAPGPESSPAPVEAPLWATGGTYGGGNNPAMAVDRQGVVHVVWTRYGRDGEGWWLNVGYVNYTSDGSWSGSVTIFDVARSERRFGSPAIAIDSHDTPHVVWMEGDAIFYASENSDDSWSPPVAVAPASCPDCNPESPDIAIDAGNEIHLLWYDHDQILWSARPSGGEWSPPAKISAGGERGGACRGPSIGVDGNDVLHAVWMEGDCDQAGSYRRQIMYSSRASEGSWSDPVVISGAAQKASAHLMAIDSTDTVHVLWPDETRSRSEKLYTSRSPDGTWSSPVSVPVDELDEWDSRATLIVAGGDNLVLMWGIDPIHYASKLAGESWSASATIPNSDGMSFAAAGDLTGNVHVIWSTGMFHYAMEPLTRIAQPAVAITERAPPDGLVEFAITTVPDGYSYPVISGNVIVWSEQGEQDWDILGYDLSTQSEFPITTQEGDQGWLSISGSIVVWKDGRATTPRIYGYDLSTGQEFPVTAKSSPQRQPSISGSIVVFQDWRKTGTCSWGGDPIFGPGTSCDWDIWGADLETKEEFPIRTENNVQRLPRVSGDTVIWVEELDDSGWAIYGYQLGTVSQPIQIAGGLSGNPQMAVDGNIVVWQVWREDMKGILGYHLPTRSEFPIAIGAGGKNEPEISGNIVVWVDTRNRGADIYGYDLASGEEFPICTAPGDQLSPAIDGDVVVWLDKRNFRTEIYGARLPAVNTEQTENVVPAPAPTPTPTPTPTPVPVAPPTPELLSPANNSVVDALFPVLRFDLRTRDPKQWGISSSSGPFDCKQEKDSSVFTCVPDNNLEPDTRYHWEVDVVYEDEDGNVQFVDTEVWWFTTASELAAPPAPVLISPPDGATVDLEDLGFQWNPVEGADQYHKGLKVGDCSDRRWSSISYSDDAPHGDIRHVGGNYTKGETYCWGVRARTKYGFSEWSVATFTISP